MIDPTEYAEARQSVVGKILAHQVTDPKLEKDTPLLCLGTKQLVEDLWPEIVQRYLTYSYHSKILIDKLEMAARRQPIDLSGRSASDC
jgi:hypothetical protein